MTRIVGRLLILWSVIAFGAGALAGPALHALPGCGHEDREHGSSEGDRGGLPAWPSSDDDCVICQAIEAPSILATASGVVGLDRVSSSMDEKTAVVWIAGHSGRWSCRAPPLVGSNCVD